VLHGAVHHGAGIHAGQRVQELVAALHAALHQRAGILAGVVGHVIGGDVQGACPGRTQAHGKAVADVEQRLGHVVAGIADGQLAIRLRLLHQLIVGVFQQIFEVDQMLQISQELHLSPNVIFTGSQVSSGLRVRLPAQGRRQADQKHSGRGCHWQRVGCRCRCRRGSQCLQYECRGSWRDLSPG